MSWSVPKTWNMGDMLTAPDLDTYVRDDSMWIYGNMTSMALVLGPNFSTAGLPYPTPYLVRRGSSVTVQGSVTNTSGATANAPNLIATLPGSEFTPTFTQQLSANLNGVWGRVDVTYTGSVSLAAGSVVNGGYVNFYGEYSLI